MTTTDTTADTCDISLNLEEDPELTYFSWKVEAEDAASSLATLVEQTGLLTSILKDPAWALYPPNRSASPGGTVTIANRPVLPTHTPITAGMTNAQISVAKYGNDRHQMWHKATETFKATLIRSLGPTLAGSIAPPPNGFKTIKVMEIMDAVEARYGAVDQVALNRMEETLSAPLEDVRDLNKHLARLTRHILMHEAAGFPLEDYIRVRFFRKSVMHLPQIATCLASHDDRHTDHRTHTFATLTKYVVEHLPPILSAATQMASQSRAFSATAATVPMMTLQEVSTAYAAVLLELNKLKKTGAKRGQKNGAKGNNKRQKASGVKDGAGDKTNKCDYYCFVHGAQNSHTSQQCKVMANQPTNFTPDQRKATSKDSPPGGSAAVRGRDPQQPATSE
jgi:hypothetical protein